MKENNETHTNDADNLSAMRLLTAARGALNGMMAEVVEDDIQIHMIEANRKPARDELRLKAN